MTVSGKCKLCLRSEVELQNSHLLPKAGYRLLTKSQGGDAPIVINPKVTISRNEQVRDYVFCKDCEDRFNKNGEGWVMKMCYRDGGSFSLKDILDEAEAEYSDSNMKVFAATKIPKVEVQKLVYFAASIFWKASVHQWRSGQHNLSVPQLGTHYSEEFRQHLLGAEEFPKNATLWLSVITESKLWDSFTFPYGGKENDYFRYHFLFRGFVFTLHLGKLVSKDIRQFCLVHSAEQFIGMSKAADNMVLTHMARLQAKSKAVSAVRAERASRK